MRVLPFRQPMRLPSFSNWTMWALELDRIGVAWDGDLRLAESGWAHHSFRGDRWCHIANAQNRRDLLNAYRVLLTRARQGMVVYVPRGDSNDPTRSPDVYRPTYEYLAALGIPALP